MLPVTASRFNNSVLNPGHFTAGLIFRRTLSKITSRQRQQRCELIVHDVEQFFDEQDADSYRRVLPNLFQVQF